MEDKGKDKGPMKLTLGGNWSIEADPSCWILKENRPMKNVKPGNPQTYAVTTYYPNLEYALRQYADKSLKDVQADKILEAIESLHVGIRKALEDHVAEHGPIEGDMVLIKPAETGKRRSR